MFVHQFLEISDKVVASAGRRESDAEILGLLDFELVKLVVAWEGKKREIPGVYLGGSNRVFAEEELGVFVLDENVSAFVGGFFAHAGLVGEVMFGTDCEGLLVRTESWIRKH